MPGLAVRGLRHERHVGEQRMGEQLGEGPPTADPVCTTTPRAPMSLPRVSACFSASADFSATAWSPEPRLIRYVAPAGRQPPGDDRVRADSC